MHSPEQDIEAQGTVRVAAPFQIVVQVAHCASQLAEEVGTEIQPVFHLLPRAGHLMWACVCPEGGTWLSDFIL